MAITDWPLNERPRERLLGKGAESLSDAELVAIFLRTGLKGKSAVDLAREVLSAFGSLSALCAADSARLLPLEAAKQRLNWTDAARHSVITTMLGRRERPPFPWQQNAPEEMARLSVEADSLKAALQPHALRRALAELEPWVARHPEDPVLAAKLADLLLRTGNVPRALELQRRACERTPWDAEVRFAYAETLRHAGRHDEAIEELRAAVDLYPAHYLAQAALGEELAARDDLRGAVRHLREAVLRAPDFATAYHTLGDVLLRDDRPEEAAAALQRAVEIEPGLAGATARSGSRQDARAAAD